MKVERYVLTLRADPKESSFSGKVAVHLEHDGGPLALNVVDLTVDSVHVAGKALAFEPVPDRQEVRIAGVPKGPAVVEVAYHGAFGEQALTGLYRTDYGSSPALVTQLEPCGARRVLPCVDHPAHKAEFQVTVDAPKGQKVLFNTPKTAERTEGDRVLHTFAPTPRMSTYLLFVGIGNFEERSARSGGVEIIVACPPGKGEQSAFALEHAARVLDFFHHYFEVAYPLPKLHLIAVPNTAVGGMENWGAITFRERALLVTPDASQATRRLVLGVIAHEIAHQWFGDLVTMQWWNDIWLNESFATFMDFKASEHLYPDWQVWSDFSMGTSNAQLWDALPHSHPVNVVVEDPDQISAIFDEISYAKGGALLRMIEGYMGEEAFRKGVARYLAKFAYGNARGEDLWACLDLEAKEPVSKVLKAWIDRPGYPALHVRADQGQVQIEQERFLLFPEEGVSTEGSWPIPLLLLADGRTERRLMAERSLALPLKDPDTLVANHGRKGYLRVRYEAGLAGALTSRYGRLDPRDRWGLLQDSYAFLLAGQLDPPTYLSALRAAGDERDYLVLNEVLSQIQLLGTVLHDRPKFRDVAAELIARQVDRLGLSPRPGESAREAVLRQGYVQARVWYDRSFAGTMAGRFDDLPRVDPSLKGAVVVAYARTGGASAYEKIFQQLQKASNDEDKTRLARGLGATTDPTCIPKAIALPFSGEVNPALGLELFQMALVNPQARDEMWKGLSEALPFLQQAFAGTGIVPILLQWAVPFLGLDREDEVRAYFAGKDMGEGSSGLRKGLDLLRVYSGVRHRFT